MRVGQEQTLVGTARAVATALHERPALFDTQSSFLADVEPGKDLYAHKIIDPIRLDGKLDDWQDYRHLTLRYDAQHRLDAATPTDTISVSFEHMVGQYGDFLYAMFEVSDDTVVMRPANSLRVDRNDFLQIALTTPEGEFKRYIVAAKKSGWVNAYLLEDNPKSLRPAQLETRIQGFWRTSADGYVLELRFPIGMMSGQIAFAIHDVDNIVQRQQHHVIGTANTDQQDSLGTVLVPSPEIENILKGLRYSNARVWVVDKHRRVLARSGSIHSSLGLQAKAKKEPATLWEKIEQHWLLPLYYRMLTKPPDNFVDELKNAYALQGKDISQALAGKPDSLWRLSSDNKAVILSAAHPIFVDNVVMGAVVAEQTTNGIRTLRNRALERLFTVILAVMLVGTVALFLFASRISFRIRKLRDQTEQAIDAHGKIIGSIVPARTRDEIGDLSRTFHNVLEKLGHYNHYLENMSSRLSHELRTPVAIVNSSLENLAMGGSEQENKDYIARAQLGIKRLSKILTNMSEATRLEQAIQETEKEPFTLHEVLCGCIEGYRMAYPARQFESQLQSKRELHGSPELFAQMLDKVIANAVEFSQAASMIVVRCEDKAEKTHITIENTGASLPDNMQHQLFDSMVSVRPHQQDSSQPHLGLGLYIANMIADFHGGKVDIRNSENGKGVRVSFVF